MTQESAFHQDNFELISKSKIYFRSYNKEWRRKPIRRDKNKVPIGRGSFWQRKSFDCSQAELWASQGHNDRIRTADLTFADSQQSIADDDCSVQTLNPEKDKDSDWNQRTGIKMSRRDKTYTLMFNSDIQFEAFDKAHPDEAFKKKSFSEWQQNNFRTRLLLHRNRLAKKLKQAKLDLKEKKESCSRQGSKTIINGRKVIVSDKAYADQSGDETATLLSE